MKSPLKNTEPTKKRNVIGMENWKLIKKGKYGFAYENKKTKDRLEAVYKPGIKFVQMMEENGYILYEKELKTKEATINYAKKMMRKH